MTDFQQDGPIKAIETRYKGYRFRSRLEARWAVFFDTVGLRYEYEKEGFDLGSSGLYLPDFWLPEIKAWFEVKGPDPTEEEHKKAAALARHTEFPVVLMAGEVGVGEFDEFRGPLEPDCMATIHFGSPGLYARHCLPTEKYDQATNLSSGGAGDEPWHLWSLFNFVLDKGFSFEASGSLEKVFDAIAESDSEYFRRTHGREHWKYCYGWHHKKNGAYGRDGGEMAEARA